MTAEVWEIIAGIFIGILVVVMITKLWDPIAEYVGYLFVDVQQHVKNLLVDAMERLREIEEELVGLDPPYPSSERCKEWVQGVRHLHVDADKIKAGLNDGWGLNYLSKSDNVKQAARVLEEATELVQMGKQLLEEVPRARPRPITLDTAADNAQHYTQRVITTNDWSLLQTVEMDRALGLGMAPPLPGTRPTYLVTDTAAQASKKRRTTTRISDSTTEQSASPSPLLATPANKFLQQSKFGNKFLQRGTSTKNVTDPAKHLTTAISRHGMHLDLINRNLWYEVEVRDFVECGESETVMGSSSWFLGISGMRGVGKTSLLRSLRDSYTNSSYFDQVFFVGAGTGCSVDRLQRVLSVYLGLLHSSDDDSNDVPAMAKLISTSLKPKTFLLLLDDVRERLDLAAVGLPMPLGHNQKVIFTTRYPDICADMGCGTGNTATIRMKCLDDYDAWSLFMDKVGVDFTHAHPHIRSLANKMVEECRGLPSALCALGRVMSTKTDVKEWRYAYDVLLKSKHTRVDEIQEMDDEGYSHLHQLEDTLQDSFL